MKVTALLLSSVTATSEFLSRHVRDTDNVSTTVFSDSPDYPAEGKKFLKEMEKADKADEANPNARSGGRNRGQGNAETGMRKITNRKRLINSQIMTPEKSAWYYHYHDYGCYCIAPSDPLKNRGKPVDEVDSACKRHALCYSCAYSDFSNGKNNCNPKQTGYKYNLSQTDSGYSISCLNPIGSCAYSACMCDKALAEELGKLVKRGVLADMEYRDYDGEKCSAKNQKAYGISGPGGDGMPGGVFMDEANAFDFEDNISIVGEERIDIQMDKQCCGVYPNRHPYKTGKNHECCDVGKSTEELKPVGTC